MKILQNSFCLQMVIALIAGILIPTGTTGQSRYIPDSLKYLGQTPPGIIPVRFPPDDLLANSDWFWHGPISFAPDLEELYWSKLTIQYPKTKIFYFPFENDQWYPAMQTNFSMDNDAYNNPFFAQSHDTLWFQSSKPGGFIYRVTRNPDYWSDPVPLQLTVPSGKSPGLQFSLNQNRDVYAEIDENGTDINIYKWKLVNGSYSAPEKLDPVINSPDFDFCPFIDPDEHFLVFSSTRPGGFGGFDLYLCNRNPDGTWSDAINLGSTINTDADEWAPSISPDSLYLFFLSQRPGDLGYNPYWVSAEVIYQLVTGIEDEAQPDKSGMYDRLDQNYPNPFTWSTSIKYSLFHAGFVTLTIYNSLGLQVTTLLNKEIPAGNHEISFEAKDTPAGIYVYQLRFDETILTRKMVVKK